MLILKILLFALCAVLGIIVLYLLFLTVCALAINPNKNYDKNSRFMKKYDLAFISKPENFKIPWFGRIIRRCCFMPIDRSSARNAMESVTRAAGLLKANEVSIAVYPEGTRSAGELLPFHNSVFKIAKWADVPIVAVTVTGTADISKRFPFRATDVHLQVVGVLNREYVAAHKTNEIGASVKALMEYELSGSKEK